MDCYFINRSNLDRLIKSLSKMYKIYAPRISGERRYFAEVDNGLEGVILSEYRTVDPIKDFYVPARSKVAAYFSQKEPSEHKRPIAIIGAKSCDLASFKVMDYVYNQEPFKDPFYISQREQNLIISTDCTSFGETCFCVAIGIMPYPTEDFDVNLSEIDAGFVVEIGSEKGKKLLKEYAQLFQSVGTYIEKRDSQRYNLKDVLLTHVKKSAIPPKDSLQSLFKKKFNSELWEETAKTCVECGACNMICPACHCFILKDQKAEGAFERLKLWDSCLLLSFAQVAGGANPRKLLAQRLRNRFDKKFNFFPDAIGRFGCTGCGRCSEACPGKIDIRKVLSGLGS